VFSITLGDDYTAVRQFPKGSSRFKFSWPPEPCLWKPMYWHSRCDRESCFERIASNQGLFMVCFVGPLVAVVFLFISTNHPLGALPY